jgi:hypothetical protein
MENKKIDDLMKQAEELAKSIGFDPKMPHKEPSLDVKIMQKIKQSLDENDLDITITPMMYNPEDFMPELGLLVKTENGFRKKYTISITENSNDSSQNK